MIYSAQDPFLRPRKLKAGSSFDDKGDDFDYMDKHGEMRRQAAEPQRDWASPVTYFDTGVEGNGCNDSDRLLMADWDKHNELCQKHFGDKAQIWGGRKPELIEAFLRDYFDKPGLVLTKIMKMYNRSNAHPIWHFQYKF
jgi:hypothetical protein